MAKSKSPNSVFVLVGNKTDLEPDLDKEAVLEWCKKNNTYFIETSVKDNKNVNEVFESLARKIYNAENSFEKSESISL